MEVLTATSKHHAARVIQYADSSSRVPETLPQEILTKMYAPAKADIPIITPEILATYDAFIFGIPTRYGNFPAQWKVIAYAT